MFSELLRKHDSHSLVRRKLTAATEAIFKKKGKTTRVIIWCRAKYIQITTLSRWRRWCQCDISMLRMRHRKQRVQCSKSKQGHTVSLMRSTWNQTQPTSYKCRAAVPAVSHTHLVKGKQQTSYQMYCRLSKLCLCCSISGFLKQQLWGHGQRQGSELNIHDV